MGLIMAEQNYALIRDGLVETVCVWDGNTETWSPPDGVLAIQTDSAGAGWTYADGVFSPPPPAETVRKREGLTANDFLDLFTTTEQATFEVSLEMVKALISKGGSPSGAQAGLLVVDRRISSTDAISLDDPRIASALDVLIAAGVIQAGRKADIIAGTPP